MSSRHAVKQQYERWPFPQIPKLAAVSRTQVWQLNLDWLRDRCRLSPSPARPRIWVAGCGTVQSHVFSLANPDADILATDVSGESLAIAKRYTSGRGGNARFQQTDLQDEDQYPDGPFDHIDCYGVLMYLKDPAETLRALARRLAVGGTLRVMTYPLFSRRTIFQLRRVARLLGLNDQDRSHPGLLRKAVGRLPGAHPLREAFTTYGDTRSDASVVDAFLNPVDRGFTATELVDMANQAGLTVGSWLHRPWGQPGPMRTSLGLDNSDDGLVLTYLDLWQELRTNLIPCFVRQDEPAHATPSAPAVHPLFQRRQRGVGLLDLASSTRAAMFGLRLGDRTAAEALRIPPATLRALRKGDTAISALSPHERRRLVAAGLLLQHGQPGKPNAVTESRDDSVRVAWATPRFELGEGSLNPMYEHLGRAWLADGLHPELGFRPLEAQLDAWEAEADPLEHPRAPFGLTAYGSWAARPAELRSWRKAALERDVARSFDEFRLPREAEKVAALPDAVAKLGLELPPGLTAAQLRELWCLLLSYEELFLDLEPG